MKVRLVMGTVIMSTSMMLSGCGSDKPEDVAETFANALSSADIEEAKEVSTEDTQKKIDRLVRACNGTYYNELVDEVVKAYTAMNSDKSSKLKNIMNKPDMTKNMEEMGKKFTEKYGDSTKLPREKQIEIAKKMMEEFSNKYIKPMISDVVDTLKIKLAHPDEVKDVMAKFIMNEGMGKRNRYTSERDAIFKIIKDGNFENPDNVTPKCVAKYTEYDFIDSINVIEVETESADRASVRLELIDKNDKSTKVSVPVEKIKDEWKVSELSLDIY